LIRVTNSALENKSIVIIGGTSGIGLSAARACVEAGAKVLAVGRNDESITSTGQALGKSGRAIAGDATDPATAPAAIDRALLEFGRFDGLYHVAGGSGRRTGDGPLHELSNEGWDFTCRLNLTSLVYSNRAAARQFLKQNSGGSVLNIGSILAFSPSTRFFATHAYAAVKAAVVGLTKSAAAYYAPHNIRFNCVVPALVETPMSQRAVGDEAIMSFVRTKQPLDGGRIGRPEDLDAAVVFFLSDASRFVTGQVLAVDGGWSVTEGQYHA
jgi:NAD(P)-dependent dehydrogenase (short-subunit alcohol dehydrogenase family)